jgi:hypothetical protein
MVHCTVKDLIGKYAGETEDKVKEKLQEARGGVLLIDEVWSLCHWPVVCSLVTCSAGVQFIRCTIREKCAGALLEHAGCGSTKTTKLLRTALNDLAGHFGRQAVGA